MAQPSENLVNFALLLFLCDSLIMGQLYEDPVDFSFQQFDLLLKLRRVMVVPIFSFAPKN